MREILVKYFSDYGITLSQEQIENYEKYYELLIEWNNKFNLTSITEKKDVVIKHFLDSVLCYKLIKDGSSIVDVGTGAGFPALPLKILNPTLKVTLVDSLNKRVVFLNEVVKALNLKDVTCIHSRAEDFAHTKQRESFDYCVARAVARLDTLSEYCLPMVRVGGHFIALKGEDGENEVSIASKAITTLGGKVKDIVILSLPEEYGKRKIVDIVKQSSTHNKYPRDKNKPKLQPIK